MTVYGILQGCYLTVFFQVILQYITVHYFSTLKWVEIVLHPSHKFVHLPGFIIVQN